MERYSYKAVDKLINEYLERGGEFVTIEGGLLDSYILFGMGLKTTICKEMYLNEWSSCYTIRMYNECPEKYKKVVELVYNDENEKATKLFFN